MTHKTESLINYLRQLRKYAMEDTPQHYKRYYFCKVCYTIYIHISIYNYGIEGYFSDYKINLTYKYIDALYNKYIMNK